MEIRTLDGLPALEPASRQIELSPTGDGAFVRAPRFVARVRSAACPIAWLEERPAITHAPSYWSLSRRIEISGRATWLARDSLVFADMMTSPCGGLIITVLDGATGRQIWQTVVELPEPAQFAEPAPAWPGAPTEEIAAFFADDPDHLILCLSRQSRRSRRVSAGASLAAQTLPAFGCQLDAIRFDLSRGESLWRFQNPDIHVGAIERRAFRGLWATGTRMGSLDFETGQCTELLRSDETLGWPVRANDLIAVPWHGSKAIGIDWIDTAGGLARRWAVAERRVHKAQLHATRAGLAVQVNDQRLQWLGHETAAQWSTVAKPFIYHVHAGSCGDVFVATDGQGGRLVAFDAASGEKTLNLKPSYGGAGELVEVPDHEALLVKFWKSALKPNSCQLQLVSMRDRSSQAIGECSELIGAWQHGAIYRAGKAGERLAMIDLR
jgi:hypothetical protein